MSWCARAVGLGYGGSWWALTILSQSSTSRLARLTMKASERAYNLLVSVQAVMEFLHFFFFFPLFVTLHHVPIAFFLLLRVSVT